MDTLRLRILDPPLPVSVPRPFGPLYSNNNVYLLSYYHVLSLHR
jgi:hypothetical protein